MSDPHSTSNVKIYDRPEKKGVNPLVIVLVLLVLVALAFGAYKMMHNTSSASPTAQNSSAAPSARSANAP